jgi:hypothetical protein
MEFWNYYLKELVSQEDWVYFFFYWFTMERNYEYECIGGAGYTLDLPISPLPLELDYYVHSAANPADWRDRF